MNNAVFRTTGLLLLLLAACGEDDKGGLNPGRDAGGGGGGAEDAGSDAATVQIHTLDRSKYTNVGVTGDLDYSIPEMWVCRPDIDPNECRQNQDATLIKSDGSRETEVHSFAQNPEFDCFYVYPTVLTNGDPQMIDFSSKGVTMVNDALLAQGARFSSMCKLYAPFYRQVGLSGGQIVAGADPALGIKDVRAAFAYYLEHLNQGRKFVLIGHSQGTSMLTQLAQMDVDPKPEVRARLLSALLIGFPVEAPVGQVVGGTFKNIPLCTMPGQIGCVIAYSSFAADKEPDQAARFGRTMNAGMQVACVNPATLANNSGRFKASYFRKSIANASFTPNTPLPEDITTPYGLYRDIFKGECVAKDGFSFLRVSLDTQAGDMRTPPWRQTTVEGIGFGLHLVDYQIPMGDLLEAVRLQADAAF